MLLYGHILSIVMLCWLAFFLYWLVSAFFVKRSVTKPNYLGAVIWRVIIALLVVLYFKLDKSSATSFFSFLVFHNLLSYAIIGSIITILGFIITIWARISLGRNWSSYVTYKKEHELITGGPYRFIRHPIYAGAIVMLIGTFLYYGVLIILVVIAIVAIFVPWRMRKEEKIMIELFGKKYMDYMKRTKKLIPGIY